MHNWVKVNREGRLLRAGAKRVSPEQIKSARMRAELSREDVARQPGEADGVFREGAPEMKYARIERNRWPVSVACAVLGVSPSLRTINVFARRDADAAAATMRCWFVS